MGDSYKDRSKLGGGSSNSGNSQTRGSQNTNAKKSEPLSSFSQVSSNVLERASLYDPVGSTTTKLVHPYYPSLLFERNTEKSEEYGTEVYEVSGDGLKNPASVTKEGRVFYKLDSSRWCPQMPGKLVIGEGVLRDCLEGIAQSHKGFECHLVATKMSKEFERQGFTPVVYDIGRSDKAETMTVMGNVVRNHFVTVVDGVAFDSRTGAEGLPFEQMLKVIQQENKAHPLKYSVAKP